MSTPHGPEGGDGANTFDAVIIGAGFAGLYQLHRLRDDLGLNTVVLETADGVGGTWYWNRYPGARCDSESHSYQYFFSREIYEGWEWSERYPGHAEIRDYLNHVADQLDLKRDIRFGTRVTSAAFDEATNCWDITTEAGGRLRATWLITAVGCLSSANVPDIPGRDEFKGEWYHTGQWPHGGVDFSGKRVGQIGTGSTGIQAVPVIAETAKTLTVFQRTPNFSVPAHNGPLSPERKQYFRENYAKIREVCESTPNGHPFRISERKAGDVGETERHGIYEKAWDVGGLRFRACFQDLLLDKSSNDTAAAFIKAKIRSIVKDPETADMLTNIDHPYAAKRPPIDTHYFEAYNRETVSLVDVRSNPIQRITPTGIETTSAHYELDTIVFATGFDAMTGPLMRIDIRGREGVTIQETWGAGPLTYLGLQVPGFPNMFTITGPGSPSVLCNMPVAIEQHVNWITDCIATMRRDGATTIEPEAHSVDDWVTHVNDAAHATLLVDAGHSWYWGANIPGKPKVFMPYAGGMTRYRGICDTVASNGYEGFRIDAASGGRQLRSGSDLANAVIGDAVGV